MAKSGRAYGRKYQRIRAMLLANNPKCYWCKERLATTADHNPPIHEVGHPHLQLVPACGPCNFGRHNAARNRIRAIPPSSIW